MNSLGLLPYNIHLGGKILQPDQRTEVEGTMACFLVSVGPFQFAQKTDNHLPDTRSFFSKDLLGAS